MKHAPKVIVLGQVCDWEEKAPFVPSGKSVLGALEYDPKMDKVKCHECGEFQRAIGVHARKAHGLDSREYKITHGLRASSSLSGPTTIAKKRSSVHLKRPPSARFMAARRTGSRKGTSQMELRNARGTCQAQLVERMKRLAEQLGRSPESKDVHAAGLSSAITTHIGRLSQLQELAGLVVTKCGMRDRFSKDILMEVLRDFFVSNKRIPSFRDWRSGLLPCPRTFKRHFGSLANAYLAAGLLNAGIREGKAA